MGGVLASPPAHVATFGRSCDGMERIVAAIATLAGALVESGELLGRAAAHADVLEVPEALWQRLGRCVPEVLEALSVDGSL